MKIRLAFLHEPGSDDMPTVIACVDEYTEDIHGGARPDFYLDDIANNSDPEWDTREAIVTVPDADVMALFTEAHLIHGTIAAAGEVDR